MKLFGLPQLKAVLNRTYALSGLAIGGIIASPLGAFIVDVGPPWPSGVLYMTAAANLVIVLLVFQGRSTSPRSLKPRGRVAKWVMATSFIAYLIVYSILVYEAPREAAQGAGSGRPDRVVMGFYPRAEVTSKIGVGLSYADSVDALKQHNLAAEHIWEPWSIAASRITLLLVWLSLFASFSVLLSSFVLSSRIRRRGNASAKASGRIKRSRRSTPNTAARADC